MIGVCLEAHGLIGLIWCHGVNRTLAQHRFNSVCCQDYELYLSLIPGDFVCSQVITLFLFIGFFFLFFVLEIHREETTLYAHLNTFLNSFLRQSKKKKKKLYLKLKAGSKHILHLRLVFLWKFLPHFFLHTFEAVTASLTGLRTELEFRFKLSV